MILKKRILFFGLLVFGLIFNLLNIFDLNYLYIRTIISFIYLTTVPGLLLISTSKIKVCFWKCVVLTVGLSISFLMFAGLLINWILPMVGISKPLSLYPTLISLDVIIIIFAVLSYYRNEDILIKIESFRLNLENIIFYSVPFIFLLLSIFGAITLNNQGPNILTMVMLSGIAAYVYFAVLFRKKLSQNIYPYAILMISLSLLLMVSLRSWYISGSDINQEYLVFQLTKHLSKWQVFSSLPVYNSCLSITILPTILSNFVNINDNYIFKILFQVIGSITPLVVYLITKKYTSTTISFLSAIFFVSYSSYFFILPMANRTEIAFLFFSLSILILLSKTIKLIVKNILFCIFTISIVLSHYSSTYIALIIFITTYITYYLLKYILHNKANINRIIIGFKERDINLKSSMVLFLVIFTIFWHMQIPPLSDNIFGFLGKTFLNMKNIFSQDVRSDQGTLKYQLFLSPESEDKSIVLDKYIKSITDASNYKNYSMTALEEDILPFKGNSTFRSIVYIFNSLNNKLIKLFIIIGIVYISLLSLKKRKIDFDYPIMNIIGLIVLFCLLILPFASIYYSINRTFQQVLILFAGPTTIGCFSIFKRFGSKFKRFGSKIALNIVMIIFLSYFLFNTGFIPQLFGGDSPFIYLNNYGSAFDQLYTYNNEIKSIIWLSNNYNQKSKIISDTSGINKIQAFGGMINVNEVGLIIPYIIDKNSYVYLTTTSSTKRVGYAWIQGQIIKYNIPYSYIENNKNLIYNNSSSEIFK